ncbi:DsbA family protein [Enterococcus sp. BWT-B8]|uniref:DsbA family protein n=1 Tax=Enterococcus sp. BWT-B8 TaxID=2885157 RepID=UPI001E4D1EFA|nr:DsbA family protein [Enterococcus sp. BWT-B8]MCB5953055.1 DsbA family protein [Enterococcus sp. BWT-B8]
MDISVIDASKATEKDGLVIGKKTAPVKIIEFMNVRCPYCKKWFEEKDELLTKYVNEGKLQRIIKLLDKEKESLQPGNVMHRFINYDLPVKGLTDLHQMFATQDQWGHLPLEQVAEFARDNLQITERDNHTVSQNVIAEAEAANIKFVPTVVVKEAIFDESITDGELINIIESHL